MAAPGSTSDPTPILECGDRIPNFVLPNHDGRTMMFYDRACGNPGIILVESEKSAALQPQIAAITAEPAAAEIATAGVELTVISRRPARACAKIAAPLDASTPVLSDPGASVIAALGSGVAPGRKPPPVFALVYNANQRVLCTMTPDDGPMAASALARIATAKPVLAEAPVVEQAPVLLIPDLLAPADCARLVEHWRTGNDEGGVSAYRDGEAKEALDISQKKRRDRLVDDMALRADVMDQVAKRLVAEMYKAFAYENFILEPPIVACYDAARQDYFNRHRDNLSPQTASRRFALSLNLNDDYDGGALIFPEYGGQDYRPAAGAGVVFSCAHIHAAQPVSRGERFVLLTFLHDPNRAPHPWSMPEQRGRAG